jgi:hypothetical protein
MSNVMTENDNDDKDDIIIVENENDVEHDDGGDDNDEHDERVATQSDENEDERAAIRERRRLEKQERKERRDKAISRDKLELDFLRKRNDDLERRLTAQEQRANQYDLNSIDAQIAKASQEAEMAERVIAKAIESGNGSDVTQALRYRDASIAKIQQLQLSKQQAQARPAQQQPDNLAMHYAKEFIKDNPWYDAQGRDEDSAIVLAIDSSLAKDGFDPQTEEYWDELRHRASRRLPERFSEGGAVKVEKKVDRQPRGGPAVGSGREHAPASTRKEVYISPERKQALIEAGVWDDPVLRMKYVKRYAEYDKNNRA